MNFFHKHHEEELEAPEFWRLDSVQVVVVIEKVLIFEVTIDVQAVKTMFESVKEVTEPVV